MFRDCSAIFCDSMHFYAIMQFCAPRPVKGNGGEQGKATIVAPGPTPGRGGLAWLGGPGLAGSQAEARLWSQVLDSF